MNLADSKFFPQVVRSWTNPLGQLGGAFRSVAVMDDLDLLQGNEPAAQHLVEEWEERLHFLLRVDDFDHHRQIHRESQDLGGVNAAGRAKPHGPAEHGRASKMKFARSPHDRFVKRLMLPTMAF